jgi:hypothetical protein
VGPDDSFFLLSGDSIAVLKLVGLARAHGLPVTVEDVFEAKTPRALAAVLSRARASGEPATVVDPANGAVEPLSARELAELLVEKLNPARQAGGNPVFQVMTRYDRVATCRALATCGPP